MFSLGLPSLIQERARRDHVRSGPEEFVDHPHEFVGARPDERVVGTIDNDELRTSDAVVKHLRVMERYGPIARGGDNERRTFDLDQAAQGLA